MSELNSERALNRLLYEIASEQGIRVESLGQGWIFRLTLGGTVRYIYGYGFDLNSAATHAIACDKSAAADVLASQGIAHVEHRLYLHPRMRQFVPHAGNWRGMLEFARQHGMDVVVKDNAGTGGRGVYRARSEVELEDAVYRLYERTHAVALSPFVLADVEYRFIMLDGRCEGAYTKQRPTVTGDGRRTILEILAAQVASEGGAGRTARTLANLDPDTAGTLGEVLPAGITRLLNWRHNLGQGATVTMVDCNAPSVAQALAIATQASHALNLRFGSVDVIGESDAPCILEVNSGVMMEFLAATQQGGYELAKSIYRKALRMMFD